MEESFYTRRDFPTGERHFIIQPARYRFVEQRLRQVFERFGFREITTPAIELANRGFEIDFHRPSDFSGFIKNSESKSIIRPDPAICIASIVSTYFRSAEKPIRFYYMASSFFFHNSQLSSEEESFLGGAEIIGSSFQDADIEMMIMAIEALLDTGITDFQMDIGHIRFWELIFKEAGFSPSEISMLLDLLRNKSFTSLYNIFNNEDIPENLRRIVKDAPFLRGKFDMLNSLKDINLSEDLIKLIEDLTATSRILENYGMGDYFCIDLSNVGDMVYQSGYVFDLYVKDSGLQIGRGGRYDKLLKQFKYPCPSTGFSLNIDYLVKSQEKLQKVDIPLPVDFFVTRTDPSVELFSIARELRRKGFLVEIEITGRNLEESLLYARKRNIKSVIILNSSETESNQIILKNMDTDDEAIIDFEEFLF